MNQITHSYWKRIDTEEAKLRSGGYISGYCPRDEVPSYGRIDTLALPTEVVVSETQNGGRKFTSPPVFGTRYAYRLQVTLSPQDIASFADKAGDALISFMSAYAVDAPVKGTCRENWWWAHHDKFFGGPGKTPNRALTKWKGPMLSAILKGHPDHDKICEEWQERLDAHKARNAQRREYLAPKVSRKKKHDDLVVLPRPVNFQSDDVLQVFIFKVEEDPFKKRNKHSLMIGATRYRYPHGSAGTFHDGRPPFEEIAPPVALALALIAHARAPLGSAHQVLAAEGKFREPYEDALRAMASFGKSATPPGTYDVATHNARNDIKAATAALKSFAISRVDMEAPAYKQEAQRALIEKAQDALALFVDWHNENPEPVSEKVAEDD